MAAEGEGLVHVHHTAVGLPVLHATIAQSAFMLPGTCSLPPRTADTSGIAHKCGTTWYTRQGSDSAQDKETMRQGEVRASFGARQLTCYLHNLSFAFILTWKRGGDAGAALYSFSCNKGM